MAKFIIQGGNKLSGTISPVGNKNAALPMLAACLLTDEKITLKNLPLIKDVFIMLEVLEDLGVEVSLKKHSVELCAANVKSGKPDPALCKRVRGSVLLAGPLMTRFKKVVLPPPGGDVIGRRRLDTHFFGFRALGAEVSFNRGFEIKSKILTGAEMLLDEASVTATENILMAASRAKGKTTIYHAACEPHVQDLCKLLVKMGAKIDGIGTNCLVLRGVAKLKGASYSISPDFMEAGSFLAASAATKGSLTLQGMRHDSIYPVMQHSFAKLGVEWEVDSTNWVLPAKQKLKVTNDVGAAVPKIEDGPWPCFPSDLMSVAIVLATQVSGSVLFFEKMFESRMYFVDRLIEMGAKIVQCDPHRVVTLGSSQLRGSFLTSPDIRAGMALLIAALCAEGESVIDNAQMIDRGYEGIEKRLQSLGADIVRED